MIEAEKQPEVIQEEKPTVQEKARSSGDGHILTQEQDSVPENVVGTGSCWKVTCQSGQWQNKEPIQPAGTDQPW